MWMVSSLSDFTAQGTCTFPFITSTGAGELDVHGGDGTKESVILG